MKPVKLIDIAFIGAFTGDRESLFTHIWKRYRKKLYYYITAVMHCPGEDGEDLLQEIMMKVYSGLDRFRSGSSFNAWIYAVARNHCIDYKRKADCRPCGEEFHDCDGGEPDPFEAACRGELHRAIHRCLQGMDDADREMVYLRHFEGLRYKTIGAVIGMNESSVKTRMRAIEGRLRRDLKEWL